MMLFSSSHSPVAFVDGISCSLVVPLIGQWFEIWWLDSVGAIVISIYIIYEWIHTYFPVSAWDTDVRAHGHIQNLAGRHASIAQIQQIVYMTSRFSDRILKVMNVSGYHAGDNILVEIDVGTSPSPTDFSRSWLTGSAE